MLEVKQLENLPLHELMPGFRGRFIHTSAMTFVYWEIEPGNPLPEHGHPHEQVVNVLEGEFSLTVDGETHLLRKGGVAIIPPHAKHSGQALTACRILDVFSPAREDYQGYTQSEP